MFVHGMAIVAALAFRDDLYGKFIEILFEIAGKRGVMGRDDEIWQIQ